MKKLFGASLAIALAAAVSPLPADAADLPEVKVSDANQVPACATPGRLMAYLRTRNSKVDPRFDGVATEYMRHGEELGLRWDIAFFQMILETGALSFKGDVRADQNNFAGLGAAGRGQHGERFPDISTGVKAHMQHLLLYAGERIDSPVAERTRKVQEWGILADWQKSVEGPMTYALVAKQWAPGSRNYVRDIAYITDRFYETVCNEPDPQPELVAEARKGREAQPQGKAEVAEAATAAPAEEPGKTESGADIARRTIEEARKEDAPRAGLGAGAAGMLGSVAATAKAAVAEPPLAASEQPAAAAVQPAVTLLNPSDAGATASAGANASAGAGDPKGAAIQTASVAGAATQLKVSPPKSSAKCKVWTASYGGQRAILIKATAQDVVNYTVLDVNEANEKREVDAYIAAYAKGGQSIGTFTSQTMALDKAFELCPEG